MKVPHRRLGAASLARSSVLPLDRKADQVKVQYQLFLTEGHSIKNRNSYNQQNEL